MPPCFELVSDKARLDRKLLLLAQPHLPTALRDLEVCHALLALLDSRCIGALLLRQVPRSSTFELRNWGIDPAYQNQGYGKKLLLYAMDFTRGNGGRYLEAGCGNAQLDLFATFQRMGFRPAGVWSDYYTDRPDVPAGTGGIVNRDMIRLQVDCSEALGKP